MMQALETTTGPMITCDVTAGLSSGSGPSSGSGFGQDSGLGFDETGHGIGILEKLREQREGSRFCDVTLLVDGIEFRAHRAVLAACSSYFETRLDGTRIARQRLVIVSRSGSHVAFEAILKYMYSGVASLREDIIADVVKFADRFSMPTLRDRCIEYLHVHLSPATCFRTRDFASGSGLTNLVRSVDAYIVANISDIVDTESALELSAAHLDNLIARSMPLSEIDRVRFICRWVERRPDERRQRLTALLASYVQWNRVGAMELCTFLRSSPVLPSDWCLYRVLQSIKDSCLLPDIYFDQLAALRESFDAEERAVGLNMIDANADANDAVSSVDDDSESIAVDIAENDLEETDEISQPDVNMTSPEVSPPVARRTRNMSRRGKTNDAGISATSDDRTQENSSAAENRAESSLMLQEVQSDVGVKMPCSAVQKSRKGTRSASSKTIRKQKENLDQNSTVETADVEPDDDDGIPPPRSATLKRKRQSRSLRRAKCRDCSFTTFSPEKLRLHMRAAHRDRQTFSCNICNYTSRWNREFYRHMREHFSGPPYRCDTCPFTADKLQSFLTHRMDHTDDRPFVCKTCSVRFKMRNNLVAHMRCHSGDKPFSCSVCGRQFATKGTLKQHEVIHSVQRPYLCDLCGFSTKFQSHLIAHRRIHTGDVYQCSVPGCSYSTPKRSQLACHTRALHLHVRSHVCPNCERPFAERSQLTRHLRTHLPEKPFACDRCPYRSTRRDKQKLHCARHHPDDETDNDSGAAAAGKTNDRNGRKSRSKRGVKVADVLPTVDELPETDGTAGSAQDITDAVMSALNIVVGVPVFVSGAGLSVPSGSGIMTTAGGGINDGTTFVNFQMPSGSGSLPGTSNLSCVMPSATMFSPLGMVGDPRTAGNAGPFYLTMMPSVDPSTLATNRSSVTDQSSGICSSLWLVNDPNDGQAASTSSNALDLTTLSSLMQIL